MIPRSNPRITPGIEARVIATGAHVYTTWPAYTSAGPGWWCVHIDGACVPILASALEPVAVLALPLPLVTEYPPLVPALDPSARWWRVPRG